MSAPYTTGRLHPTVLAADVAGLRAVSSATFTDGVEARLFNAGLPSRFSWNSAETTADDGVNYVKPSDVSGAGRWVWVPAPQALVFFTFPAVLITGSGGDGPVGMQMLDAANDFPGYTKATLKGTLWTDIQSNPPDWATSTSYSSGDWVRNTVDGSPALFYCTAPGLSASSGPGPNVFGTGINDGGGGGVTWRSAQATLVLVDFGTASVLHTVMTSYTLGAGLSVGIAPGIVKFEVDVTSVIGALTPGVHVLAIGLGGDPGDVGPTYYTKTVSTDTRLVFLAP